jgi:hypothetical protein
MLGLRSKSPATPGTKLAVVICGLAALAMADGFTFAIGSPVAAQDFRAKTSKFVFRTEGCADPARAQISGTAEGLVKGARRSTPLQIATMSKPGVYAVFQNWGSEGEWVVNLKGACAGATAGAIVPLGPKGFLRESSKFFPRPATDVEIEASLKALAQGGSR